MGAVKRISGFLLAMPVPRPQFLKNLDIRGDLPPAIPRKSLTA
jgi:hypothetical protein